MKIINVKSICCGEGVMVRSQDKARKDGYVYICSSCGRPCDGFFKTLMSHAEIEYLDSLASRG